MSGVLSLEDSISAIFRELFQSASHYLHWSAYVCPQEIADLTSAVGGVLNRPSEQHVLSGRLAFADEDVLRYPERASDVRQLAANTTAVLQSLELSGGAPSLIASNLERRFARPASVAAYISSPHSHSFDWHTDKWDSVVVQLIGRKVFFLRSGEDAKIEDARNVALFPGDVLAFGPTVVHRAITESPSLHLSFTLRDHF